MSKNTYDFDPLLQHWAHGSAECLDCQHTWVAVWPLGADALECPECHSTNTDRIQRKYPEPPLSQS
jgi:Zn finger protein HypA/HybF involved in hydrogenase expression